MVAVTLLRSRRWTRVRASLVASAVAVAAILSLIGAYVRAPESLLGVAFARACAAERAVTERTQPRLRVDREDAHIDDSDGLPPSFDAMKAGSPPRAVGDPPTFRGAAVTLRSVTELSTGPSLDPGAPRVSIGRPTRQRARLMVYLN